MAKIKVQNTEITFVSHHDKDYISLTDMANGKQSESRAADIIKNWIRTRYTIELLGTWEMIHNSNFNLVEFDHLFPLIKTNLQSLRIWDFRILYFM